MKTKHLASKLHQKLQTAMIRVKSTELHFNNFPRKTLERGNLNNGEVASVTKYLLMRKKNGSIQSAKILFHYQLTCI